MSHAILDRPEARPASADDQTPTLGFFRRLPRAAWIAALLAAVLHMLPLLRATLDAPPGWEATGALTVSPDFMQYRVWMRQSLEEGPIVSNRFTAEDNHPYLPVPFYYAVGRAAQAAGIAPEWMFAWVGSVLAAILTLLVFATARHFLRTRVAVWTAFIAIMVGGGLGGYFIFLRRLSIVRDVRPLQMLFVEPFKQYNEVLDGLRGDYVFVTLFDPHFLLIWIFAVAAILSFYATLRSYSALRLAGTAALFAGATIIHVYEGVTLIMIASGITLLCRIKGIRRRESLTATVACSLAVGVVFVWIAYLVKSSGLPMPPWRGVPVHPTLLFLGFPLAWVLVVWGLARYWRTAGLEEVFLLGWLLGCTSLTLSAPFYPWPNRGVLSMQIPLTIAAAAIWFAHRPRLSWRAVVIAVLLMGSTPLFRLQNRWLTSAFSPTQPHKFLGPPHRPILDVLHARANEGDVLVAGSDERLWLAPDFRGRHYAGHFFLTVDYDRKQAEVDRFYGGDLNTRQEFLRSHNVRFVYVSARQDPASFRSVPGLVPLQETTAGTLFEYTRGQRAGDV